MDWNGKVWLVEAGDEAPTDIEPGTLILEKVEAI